MNRKSLYFIEISVSLAVAVLTSFVYAEKGWAWLLCITGCAVMFFLAALVGLFKAWRAPATDKTGSVYRRKSAYLSPAEAEFLHALRGVLGGRYEVYPQAPLVSVIDKQGASFRNELFRVVDYIVVDPVNNAPLLLVELNDASHKRADRAERDRKVAEICAAAQMPLVSFTLEQSRNLAEVRKTIMKSLRR